MSSKLKACPVCLHENDVNSKFCNNCGFDFRKQAENEFNINVFYNIDDLIDDAILVYEGENYERSLELIDDYLEEDQDEEYAWAFKSHVLSKLGYSNDAITCCDIALNIDDSFEIAWASKAFHLYLLKNYDAALSCCQAALILNSEDEFVKKLIELINSKKDSEEI